jgi:hypothetical protein
VITLTATVDYKTKKRSFSTEILVEEETVSEATTALKLAIQELEGAQDTVYPPRWEKEIVISGDQKSIPPSSSLARPVIRWI